MDALDANIPENGAERQLPSWTEAVLTPGVHTQRLISETPNIGRLAQLRILERLSPYSDKGIVLYPGALDHLTEDEALVWAGELGASAFHIKYPADSSFSIDREVSQVIDHTEAAGVRNYQIMSGSWGGIPALRTAYKLLGDEGVNVDCFIGVAAALQPSDLAPIIKKVGVLSSSILWATKNFKVPYRQLMARIASGVKDAEFDDQTRLEKMRKIPTLLLVPPKESDWWVDARRSYEKYFPDATVVECPVYTNFRQKVQTIGGHNTGGLITEIRQIERSFLRNKNIDLALPAGFVQIR